MEAKKLRATSDIIQQYRYAKQRKSDAQRKLCNTHLQPHVLVESRNDFAAWSHIVQSLEEAYSLGYDS